MEVILKYIKQGCCRIMNNEKLISIKVPSIALFSLLPEIQSRTASIPKSSR